MSAFKGLGLVSEIRSSDCTASNLNIFSMLLASVFILYCLTVELFYSLYLYIGYFLANIEIGIGLIKSKSVEP